jgi:hypothetical protein
MWNILRDVERVRDKVLTWDGVSDGMYGEIWWAR